MRNAWGLPDKDGFPDGDSDPYVTVTAVRESSLTRTSRNTHEVKKIQEIQPGIRAFGLAVDVGGSLK